SPVNAAHRRQSHTGQPPGRIIGGRSVSKLILRPIGGRHAGQQRQVDRRRRRRVGIHRRARDVRRRVSEGVGGRRAIEGGQHDVVNDGRVITGGVGSEVNRLRAPP